MNLVLSPVSPGGIVSKPLLRVRDGPVPPGHFRQKVHGGVGQLQTLLGKTRSDHGAVDAIDWKSGFGRI